MKITYLVANYNNSTYLQDCIDSLNNQTSDSWLCIVCDDASTDDSVQLLEKNISDKISLLKNKKNIGYIKTLERLIDSSTTDIVGILDADDALYPNATHEVLDIYKNHSQYGFVYTNFQAFDKSFQHAIEFTQCSNVPINKTALIYGFVSHLKTFRKKDYYRTPMYDDEILYAEDRDLVYMMEEVTNFYFIDKKLYKYRVLPNSQSKGRKKGISIKNHVKARKKAISRRGIKGFDFFLHTIINFTILYKNRITIRVSRIINRKICQTNHSSGRLHRRR